MAAPRDGSAGLARLVTRAARGASPDAPTQTLLDVERTAAGIEQRSALYRRESRSP